MVVEKFTILGLKFCFSRTYVFVIFGKKLNDKRIRVSDEKKSV